MEKRIFISYSRKDMDQVDWLYQLKVYLNQFGEPITEDCWDDTDIPTGAQWYGEIMEALDHARVAILLVGPGFLGTKFIRTVELPKLLAAIKSRRLKILPLVVRPCAYDTSLLGSLKPFNDWKKPINSLPGQHPQDDLLNRFSQEVASALKQSPPRPEIPFSSSISVPSINRLNFFVCQLGDEVHVSLVGWARQFHVSAVVLQDLIDRVRGDLDNLCKEHIFCAGSDIVPALRRLAEDGAILRDYIFGPAAQQIEQLFNSTREDPALFFFDTGETNVHIPWGLLFNGFGIDNFKDVSEEQLMAGFWAMKYDVSVVYSGNKIEKPMESLLCLSTTGLSGIFHRGAVEFADPTGHTKWPSEFRIESIDELRSFWSQVSEDCLIYFFCHAIGDELIITDARGEQLKPNRLRFILGLGQKRRGLFIFNGWNTGLIPKGGKSDLLKLTREDGFRGFVGTEAPIPTRFAWNMGRDLLHLMIKRGYTAIQAMRVLRRQHWPLSLLYGLYCFPDTKVSVCPNAQEEMLFEFLPEPDASTNYSFLDPGECHNQHVTLPFSEYQGHPPR